LYDAGVRFLLRVLLNAVAVIVAAWLVPGVVVSGPAAAIVAGLLLGVVNALVRPVLLLLTLPFTLLTLGLFIFVVNAICFGLTAALVPGFQISGFWAALFGSIVVSIVSWMLSSLLTDNNERHHYPPS
jgi:putative membrane protein